MKMKWISILMVAWVLCGAALGPAQADTLENMERERAILLDALLSPGLTVAEREGRITISKTRLIDLERMVLRDKSLMGRNTPTVRAAFENYDLTFLVHATAETLEPHRIAAYARSLAEAFNAFYQACPVLKADTDDLRRSRLRLADLTGRVLCDALNLLGIEAPDRM